MSQCLICGKTMVEVPAGVSKKTGKAYNAFMACPDKCQQPRNSTSSYVPYKATQANSSPVTPQGGINSRTEDIRSNVALKMVSEIIAGGQIKVEDWEKWANIFYNYTPNIKDPFAVNIDKKADELLNKQDQVDLSQIKF